MARVLIEGHRKDKMKHVNLSEIEVGQRFREDLGDLDELVDSIKEKGVIQPITVDSGLRLLAGGRRVAASLQLGLPTIPAIVRDFVDELDSREIELIENIHRKGFTWSEEAKLVKEIDALYRKKNGSSWSGRKTAELVDKGVSTVARHLQLATAMELLPELAEEKTADDALKVLKKLEEDALTHELRARQDARHLAEGHADPNVVHTQLDQGIKTILHLAKNNYCIGDAFTGMQSLRTDGAIDIIECDPPYGIELNEQKGSKQSAVSTVHTYEEIDAVAYPSFLDRLATELFRVAGKDSWLVFWFGPSWHNQVLTSLRKAGWHVDEIPAIWAKNQGQTIQPEIYMARGYEPFFLCRKGKPILHQRGRLNVFNFAGVPGKTKYHPTQRPIDLIKEVLGTLGGGLRQRVFVPFLGSGATLLACYDLGYQGFGYDLNGEYKDKFLLEAEARTRKLFDEAEQE